ncbi:MAG: amidohydrolase family protein [Planctomycetota bacterium]|jgi:imidazolonepropionase-like amidohydrolase
MKKIKHIISIASLLLLCVYTNVSGTENVAIQEGNILTISGEAIEHGSILIKDGKIKSLGRDVTIPAGTRTIDANDRFVMPGLIDAQSRLFVIESELNESRAIVPHLNILDGLNPFMKGCREVLAQGVTAVYVAPGTRSLIGGKGAVLKLNGAKTAKEMVLKENVAVKAAIGVSSNNQSSSLIRLENYSSIREAFIETQAYLRSKRKYDQELAEYNKKKAEKGKENNNDGKGTDKKEKPKRPDL